MVHLQALEVDESTTTNQGFPRLYTTFEKDKAIKKEIRRLQKILKTISPEHMKVAEGLIQETAFMRATLAETRFVIDQEGVLDMFEQGKQSFIREHPATKVYGTLIMRYTAACKQLFDLLPDKAKTGEIQSDELVNFLKKHQRK
jgi:hypothetical protein